MAQFDVHANPGRLRSEAPFLVVVQSSRFDASPARLVIPLVSRSGFLARPDTVHNEIAPRFRVEGRDVVLSPLQTFSIAVSRLGPPIASLADDASAARIIAAIDEVIATAFR
jgi:toxin CcdB